MRWAVLASIILSALLAAPATATHGRRIASYCSPSGDVCYGIFDDSGTIRFQLTLAARYFSRYRLCVRPPTGATNCRSFPVKQTSGVFGGAEEGPVGFQQSQVHARGRPRMGGAILL